MCCVCVRVCVCPGEGIVAFSATPNPFRLNKICLNQSWNFKFPPRIPGIQGIHFCYSSFSSYLIILNFLPEKPGKYATL